MSGQNRTFVLQVVGVALLVGIIFFAFLRPSDPGELAGIDAPEGDAPAFGLPGPDRDGEGRDGSQGDSRSAGRGRGDGERTLTSSAASSGGLATPALGDAPADDQYTSAATSLMERVEAASSGGDR